MNCFKPSVSSTACDVNLSVTSVVVVIAAVPGSLPQCCWQVSLLRCCFPTTDSRVQNQEIQMILSCRVKSYKDDMESGFTIHPHMSWFNTGILLLYWPTPWRTGMLYCFNNALWCGNKLVWGSVLLATADFRIPVFRGSSGFCQNRAEATAEGPAKNEVWHEFQHHRQWQRQVQADTHFET